MGNYNIDNLKEDFADEDADIRVTLTLEDDSEEECRILTIFDMDGNDYIALLPLDENGDDNEEGEVYLYRYEEDEEGEASLSDIEDEDEYDAVVDRFDELLDEAEWNVLLDDDDDEE